METSLKYVTVGGSKMTRFIVPIITSYNEYISIEAESEKEAIELVRDGAGEEIEDLKEFRETIAIQEDMVEEEPEDTPEDGQQIAVRGMADLMNVLNGGDDND